MGTNDDRNENPTTGNGPQPGDAGRNDGPTRLNPWPAIAMIITAATSIIASSFAIGWLGLITGAIALILAAVVAKNEPFHAWNPGDRLYGDAIIMKFSWQKTVAGCALLAVMGLILGVMLVIAG